VSFINTGAITKFHNQIQNKNNQINKISFKMQTINCFLPESSGYYDNFHFFQPNKLTIWVCGRKKSIESGLGLTPAGILLAVAGAVEGPVLGAVALVAADGRCAHLVGTGDVALIQQIRRKGVGCFAAEIWHADTFFLLSQAIYFEPTSASEIFILDELQKLREYFRRSLIASVAAVAHAVPVGGGRLEHAQREVVELQLVVLGLRVEVPFGHDALLAQRFLVRLELVALIATIVAAFGNWNNYFLTEL
jgi:hypothetical protein